MHALKVLRETRGALDFELNLFHNDIYDSVNE